MKKLICLFLSIFLLVSMASCDFNFPFFDNNNQTPEVKPTDDEVTNGNESNTNDDKPNEGNNNNNQQTENKPTEGNNSGGSSNNNQPTQDVNKEYTIKSPVYTTRTVLNKDDVTMNDFFDLGNRVDIKIYISQKELSKLQSDYETGAKSEIYRLANKVIISLKNNNKTYTWEYENVGIRQKGNTSRQPIYDGEQNINLNHYKLSFDETFSDPLMYDNSFISKYGNDEYKNRDFLGMSGLDFKWNKNEDATHIREVYASYLYRACGIMAQNSGLSTLSLVETDRSNKATSLGLCTVYEPATKSFIKRALKSEDSYINMSSWDIEKEGTYGVEAEKYGDLYKCIYGANFTKQSISGSNIGISNISGTYIPLYDRKTNKDVVYGDTLLKNAVTGISSRNYSNIEKFVDLEYLAISEAVGYFVGNPDSMRYNMNNFMIYLRRTDGKMVFIPIDNDRCFGITKDWNPRDGYMYTSPLDRKDSTNNDTITLLLDTILAKTDNKAKTLYLDYIDKISKSEWLTNECFNKFYDKAKASYSGYNFSLNDDINYSFKTYISNKLKQVGNNDTNENNNQSASSIYDRLYLVSTVNNWNSNDDYKLKKIGENTYSVTITVNQLEKDGDYIKFKFNNGGSDYSVIDWSIDQNTNKLNLNGGSSYKYYGVKKGDKLTITINVSTLEVEIIKD